MVKQYNNSILFLGTGTSQGVPVIGCKCMVCTSNNPRDKRLRTSAYIIYKGVRFLIDVGPDFRIQFLDNNLDNLDAVLFTHEHKDHTGGLDDLRPINFKHQKHIPLYGQQSVLDELKSAYRYAFTQDKYPGAPSFDLHPIQAGCMDFKTVNLEAIEVMHGTLPILSFRFGDLAYITDANFISRESKSKLQNLDVLVLNALRLEKHHSHFTLADALQMNEELKPKRMILTHISHLLGSAEAVETSLPKNVCLAYDGLKLNF